MKRFESISCHKKAVQFLIFLLFPVGLAFNVNLIAPLIDGFHEGEYLDNLLTLRSYYAGTSGFPLLIHGAMDYLPSLLAARIAGDDHILVWTRFLNILAVAACWVLYLDTARKVVREQSNRHVCTTIFFLLFAWMAVAPGEDPVRKQQAFLGTRDLFLMLSLWAGANAIYTQKVSSNYLGLIASGVFAGLCLYWSYDRGVLCAVWVVCLAIAFAYQKRSGYAATLLLAYAVALMVISETGVVGSLQENVDNIVYWIKNTGDIWSISFHDKRFALPSSVAMALLALASILHAVLRMTKSRPQKNFPFVLGLIMIQMVFLTKLYSLPSFPTTYYFIWPTFLLLIAMPPTSALLDGINQSLRELFGIVKQTISVWKKEKAIVFGVLVMALLLSSNGIVSGAYTLVQLKHPIADEKLIDANHYGISAVTGNSSGCIFQWTNEGVFSTLLKKPYCTQYGYAVYIAKNREIAVLDDLRKSPPGLIIYDSPHWSVSIYGRHMRNRLPAIDRFIHENYVFHDSVTGYVFATPKLEEHLK